MHVNTYAYHVNGIASSHAVDYQLVASTACLTDIYVLSIGTTISITLLSAYRAKTTCVAASATRTEVVAWLHACMTFSELHFYKMMSLELAQPVVICMMRTALGCKDP